MTDKGMPTEIAGYRFRVVEVGRHKLGHVEVTDDVTVVFRLNDDGGGDPFPNGDCLGCIISNISACAAEVCPPIKANDPEASCSEEIRACAREKCRSSCGGGLSGVGDFMVIA